MDEVVRVALEEQLVVEREVERDRDTVARRDRPALLAAALDEHLVGLELVAEDTEAPAVELLELAGRERGTNGAELLAELRPERGQVRLHVELDGFDVAELDAPRRAARRRSLSRCPSTRAPSTTRRRSGCRSLIPELERACRPSSTTRRTSAISVRNARSGSSDLGPAGEVDGLRPVEHERPPEVVGDEWHVPARVRAGSGRARTRACAARPRPRPRSGAASGGCTSSRGRRGTPRSHASRPPRASARSPAAASATKARVRSTSQRSSGSVASGSSDPHFGSKPATFA